jgi:hypothetical protein
MMRKLCYLFLLGAILLTTTCTSDSASRDTDEADKKTAAVDYEKLQDLLPKRLAGMDRVAIEGERIGFLGLKYSQATAEYEDGDAWAEIIILDGGGIARVVNKLADEINTDFDHEYENEEGYRRNIEVDGFPASEMYEYDAKEGEFTVFVGERFLVHLEAEDISERQFKRLNQALDIKRLSRLK